MLYKCTCGIHFGCKRLIAKVDNVSNNTVAIYKVVDK